MSLLRSLPMNDLKGLLQFHIVSRRGHCGRELHCQIFSHRPFQSGDSTGWTDYVAVFVPVWLQFPHRAQCSSSPPSQPNTDLPELGGLSFYSLSIFMDIGRRTLYTTTENPLQQTATPTHPNFFKAVSWERRKYPAGAEHLLTSCRCCGLCYSCTVQTTTLELSGSAGTTTYNTEELELPIIGQISKSFTLVYSF